MAFDDFTEKNRARWVSDACWVKTGDYLRDIKIVLYFSIKKELSVPQSVSNDCK